VQRGWQPRVGLQLGLPCLLGVSTLCGPRPAGGARASQLCRLKGVHLVEGVLQQLVRELAPV